MYGTVVGIQAAADAKQLYPQTHNPPPGDVSMEDFSPEVKPPETSGISSLLLLFKLSSPVVQVLLHKQ